MKRKGRQEGLSFLCGSELHHPFDWAEGVSESYFASGTTPMLAAKRASPPFVESLRSVAEYASAPEV